MESFGQLGIYRNFLCRVNLTNKLAFSLAIRKHIIHDAFLALEGTVYCSVFFLREDVAVKLSVYPVVADMLNDDCGFLLQNQACYLADKLFWVHHIHVKL